MALHDGNPMHSINSTVYHFCEIVKSYTCVRNAIASNFALIELVLAYKGLKSFTNQEPLFLLP